eukprot:scaffold67236_cov26-Attheya_sp.AAC.1
MTKTSVKMAVVARNIPTANMLVACVLITCMVVLSSVDAAFISSITYATHTSRRSISISKGGGQGMTTKSRKQSRFMIANAGISPFPSSAPRTGPFQMVAA